MRFLLGILFTFALAGVTGLGLTWLALTSGVAFGGLHVGAWSAWPKTGTPDIDPYARAFVSRTGVLPVGSGDGVAFSAHSDDGGAALDGRCEIAIEGTTPNARFWTLSLYDPEGRLIPTTLGRHGFTSQEIVRRGDGSFAISVGPRARPGNWLPTGGVERYVLLLRLYDTPIGVATRAGRETPMPTITRRACP